MSKLLIITILQNVSVALPSGATAEIKWKPIRASGVEGQDWWFGSGEHEITLVGNDQFVSFEVFISDFAPENLATYQMIMECPAFQTDGSGQAFVPDLICPFDGDFDTDYCHGIDETRPDYVFYEIPTILSLTQTCCSDCTGMGLDEFEIFGTAFNSASDQGIDHYAATLALYFSNESDGTFRISLNDSTNYTYLANDVAEQIQIAAIHDGFITFATGACCTEGGCVDGQSFADCETLEGELFVDASCDQDSDGDRIPDACDICPDVNNNEHPGCAAIPTVSEWGVGIMLSLLLAAGAVSFGRVSA
ncbi:MAG: hypothetical protein ACYTHJ_02580 [Planctomycetota bacterium]